MFDIDLAYPFTLGIVAAFNPCGFAMLPVYVSFFLGKNTDSETSTSRNLFRALKVSTSLTLGFIFVFGGFGLLTSSLLSQGSVLEYTPYVTFGLGFLLIPLGIAMLRGFELKLSIPRLERGGDSGEVVSMFLFGVSYAVVSLGCTIGLFLGVVTNAFTKSGYVEGVSVFLAYGIGMGAVITTLTVGLAAARTSIATNMRKLLAWINPISGVLLALSGAYLIIYGWWEIQVLRGNFATNRFVDFFTTMQTEVNIWIGQTGATRLGVALLLIVAAAVVRAVWPSQPQNNRIALLGGLGLAWVLAEFVWQRGNLFVLPIIRTIGDLPERFANWFTDPLRWAVLGEIIVLAIVGSAIWFRVRRGHNDAQDRLSAAT